MSFHSSSGLSEESSSVEYSSLDSCNSLSVHDEQKYDVTNKPKSTHYSHSNYEDPYLDKYDNEYMETDLLLINKWKNEIYGNHKSSLQINENLPPLPAISSVKLQKVIQFEFDQNTNVIQINHDGIITNHIPIIHLIMNYFHPIQHIKIHFVKLNGLISSNMSCCQLIMYKNDTILNLQQNIAETYGVNTDQLILCEFWKSILTKLKYENMAMINPSDQIIAYYMPYYIQIRKLLFDKYDNDELSYTSLVHQCHNFIDDDEQSLSSLNFQLHHYPYFDRAQSVSNTSKPHHLQRQTSAASQSELYEHSIISELSMNDTTLSMDKNMATYNPVIPPTIDENDSLSECEGDDEKGGGRLSLNINNNSNNIKYGQHLEVSRQSSHLQQVDVVNVGIPIPLMLPKNTLVSTNVIRKQCEMILSPYLKIWKNNKLRPYDLYILSKNTMYCGICQNNAFCTGCKLDKYQEMNTKELDFIISIRWTDEDSFNSFDQTVFSLSK